MKQKDCFRGKETISILTQYEPLLPHLCQRLSILFWFCVCVCLSVIPV